jgi:hypothetical protein
MGKQTTYDRGMATTSEGSGDNTSLAIINFRGRSTWFSLLGEGGYLVQ